MVQPGEMITLLQQQLGKAFAAQEAGGAMLSVRAWQSLSSGTNSTILDSPFVTRIRSVDPQDVYNAHCTFNLLDHDEKISGVAKFGQRTLQFKHYGPEFAADRTYNPT